MVPDRSFSTAHVAFAVPRAVGPAVVRNRVRRRLREHLRVRDLTPGLYLWGAGESAGSLSFTDMGRHVDTLVARGYSRWASSRPRSEVEKGEVERSEVD